MKTFMLALACVAICAVAQADDFSWYLKLATSPDYLLCYTIPGTPGGGGGYVGPGWFALLGGAGAVAAGAYGWEKWKKSGDDTSGDDTQYG